MLKKLSFLFLFTGMFSLQAIQTSPAICPVSFFEDCLKIFDITLVVFHNNTQKIKSLANIVGQQTFLVPLVESTDLSEVIRFFPYHRHACLIMADINNVQQKIFFNITAKPTIIYYRNCKEIARSTNFNPQRILHYITTINRIFMKVEDYISYKYAKAPVC